MERVRSLRRRKREEGEGRGRGLIACGADGYQSLNTFRASLSGAFYAGALDALQNNSDNAFESLGQVDNPEPGLGNPAEGMQPFELLPEQAVNLTLVWYWADEPYAALQVGSYRWTIQLVRR